MNNEWGVGAGPLSFAKLTVYFHWRAQEREKLVLNRHHVLLYCLMHFVFLLLLLFLLSWAQFTVYVHDSIPTLQIFHIFHTKTEKLCSRNRNKNSQMHLHSIQLSHLMIIINNGGVHHQTLPLASNALRFICQSGMLVIVLFITVLVF